MILQYHTVSDGSTHLHFGIQGVAAKLEADLIVAFAGGPVGDVCCPLRLRRFYQTPGFNQSQSS